MGVVYEAEDLERGARVALKALKGATADTLYRFKNEFRALQGLEHPNLVSLGELIEDRGKWFFTMELVEGTDLLAHVRDPKALAAAGPPAAERGFDEERLGFDPEVAVRPRVFSRGAVYEGIVVVVSRVDARGAAVAAAVSRCGERDECRASENPVHAGVPHRDPVCCRTGARGNGLLSPSGGRPVARYPRRRLPRAIAVVADSW